MFFSTTHTHNNYTDGNGAVYIKYTHLSRDIMYLGQERIGSGTIYNKCFATAREIAKDCIEKYAKGDKEPLAKLIGNAIKNQVKVENSVNAFADKTVYAIDTTQKLMGLLEKDPELMKQSGLTEDDMEKYRGQVKMAEICKKGLESRALLHKAGMGEIQITDEQKKNALLDVFAAKVMVNIDNAHRKNCQDTVEKDDIEKYAKQSQQVGKRKSDAMMKKLALPENDPGREEYQRIMDDTELEVESIQAKMFVVSSSRKCSMAMKLAGTDNEEHTLLNELKEKISHTKVFETFMNMSLGELRNRQNTSPAKIEADFSSATNEIIEKQMKEDKAQNVKVNENVNELNVNQINNDGQKLPGA